MSLWYADGSASGSVIGCVRKYANCAAVLDACSPTVGHDEWVTPTQMNAQAMLAAFLGPQTEPVPLDSEVLESIELDGYVRNKVVYSAAPGVRVGAYVCRPLAPAGAVPGVFCHHQHAGDFALGKSESVGLVGDASLAYAAELAAEGFVTIAPDAIGFEERNWSRDGAGDVTWFELSRRLLKGRTLLADCLREVTVGLDYLAALPEVDPTRLGFIGHSYGGRMALFAPAFDHRIRASVSNCQCIPYRMTFSEDVGCQAEFVLPGFAEEHDLEDLFDAYSAQTQLLLSVGRADRFSRGYNEVFEGARGALSNRVSLRVHDTGHAFTSQMRRAAYDFLHHGLASAGPAATADA